MIAAIEAYAIRRKFNSPNPRNACEKLLEDFLLLRYFLFYFPWADMALPNGTIAAYRLWTGNFFVPCCNKKTHTMRRYRRKPDNRDDGKIFRRAYIYYLTASYTQLAFYVCGKCAHERFGPLPGFPSRSFSSIITTGTISLLLP